MTGQEELEYIGLLKNKVEEQNLYIESLYGAMTGISGIRYDKDRVQTSVQGDQMTEILVKIEEAREKLKKLEKDLLDYQIGCIDRIHLMKSLDHQKLLYLIYIDGLTLKETASKMCWSYGYTRNKHWIALKEYEHVTQM